MTTAARADVGEKARRASIFNSIRSIHPAKQSLLSAKCPRYPLNARSLHFSVLSLEGVRPYSLFSAYSDKAALFGIFDRKWLIGVVRTSAPPRSRPFQTSPW
jgi:hypothetical protein